MIVTGIIPSAGPFVGDGTDKVFSWAFPTFESGNIKATVTDPDGAKTTLVISTDYTLDGVGRANGGDLTLVNSGQAWLDAEGDLKTGYELFIEYKAVPNQLFKFRDLGPHAPVTFERALDRLTMDIIAFLQNEQSIGVLADEFLDNAYVPGTVQSIGAGGTIAISKLHRQHVRVKSSGGALALSNTPFGTDTSKFRDGMEIVVEGDSDVDYLTVAEQNIDYGALPSGGLQLKTKFLITFVYSARRKRFLVKSTGVW